jgi:hypothetical protein
MDVLNKHPLLLNLVVEFWKCCGVAVLLAMSVAFLVLGAEMKNIDWESGIVEMLVFAFADVLQKLAI